MAALATLLKEVSACTLCAKALPCTPRPVLQANEAARILIAGQAPGRKVHATGIPFNDASGERLRTWLGMTKAIFYNPQHIAIVPMGFCYPGTGKSGDLPPRTECAATWRKPILSRLKNLSLTVVIGQYAQAYHLPEYTTLTASVQAWQQHWPHTITLPHPSPRNNLWLRRNPWFENEVVPALQKQVQTILNLALLI